MKRFLLTLSVLALTASLASAECYETKYIIAPTKAKAIRSAELSWNMITPRSCELDSPEPHGDDTAIWRCTIPKIIGCTADAPRTLTPAQIEMVAKHRPYIETVHPYTGGDYEGVDHELFHCNSDHRCYRKYE